MGQNIRLVNDILEQTKLQSIPGILLQLDFCKAFDTIEWSFIYKVIALWWQYAALDFDLLLKF